MPGDLLSIRIRGLYADPGIVVTTAARVQADGTIGVPVIPPVVVAGLDRAAAVRLLDRVFVPCFGPPLGFDVLRLQRAGTGGPNPGPIAPFDLVRCVVGGLDAEQGTAQVLISRLTLQGTIDLPLIGAVHIAGLTDVAAARVVQSAYRDANVLGNAEVSVLTLERAPSDAAHRALPNGPLNPVPQPLRSLYLSR